MGCRARLFAGSEQVGQRAAIAMSLNQSTCVCGHYPHPVYRMSFSACLRIWTAAFTSYCRIAGNPSPDSAAGPLPIMIGKMARPAACPWAAVTSLAADRRIKRIKWAVALVAEVIATTVLYACSNSQRPLTIISQN